MRGRGICGSDIPRIMEKGAYKYPITVGHEFAGQAAVAFELGAIGYLAMQKNGIKDFFIFY